MNHDSNPPSAPTPPELEARVVAWVAGELTDTEIKELAPLVAASPELTIFKRRIEAVHGLVTEAERPETEPLRLSSDRRAKLLQTIGGAVETASTAAKATAPVIPLPAVSRGKRWNYQWWIATAAACMTIGFFVVSSIPHFSKARKPLRPDPMSTSAIMELPSALAVAESDSSSASMTASRGVATQVVGEPLADKADAPASGTLIDRKSVSLNLTAPDRAVLGWAAFGSGRQTITSGDNVDFSTKTGTTPYVTFDTTTIQPAGSVNKINPMVGAGVNGLGGKFYGNLFTPSANRPGSGTTMLGQSGADSQPAIPPTNLDTVFPPATPSSPTTFDSKGNTYVLNTGGIVITETAQINVGGFYASTVPEAAGFFRPRDAVQFNGTGATDNVVVQGTVSVDGAPKAKNAPESPVAPAEGTIELQSFAVAGSREGNARALAPAAAQSKTAGATATLGSTGAVSINSVGVSAVGGGLNIATNGGKLSPAAASTAADNETLTLSAFTVSSPTKAKTETRGTVVIHAPVLSAVTTPTGPAESQAKASSSQALFAASGDVTLTAGTNDFTNVALIGGASADRDEARRPAPAQPAPLPPVEETATAQDPVSTFSLHVSDVSFRLAQAALARGEAPDHARIRPEEFYNAFDYGDPAITTAEKIGARLEQAAHPFLQQRNLVRIALKVPATGRGTGTPLHLTVLLDTSGSMEREDRAASVRRALEVLVSLLGPDDRLTLVGFARTPRLIAEALPGDQARQILDLLARTPSEGGTNLEEALKLGGELAYRHRAPNAQNRLVLLTDGAANLGDADPTHLTAMVTTLRQAGIAFDACGVGLNGLDDEILEALTRQGDGRYYVLNSPADADTGFARQLAGAFRPAAENVKVQVRFNPARVGHYRLIGFEQHRLREQDFRNDKVDAAELAAEEAAVALYQVEVLPQGEGELGEVFVRFRDVASGTMVERSWSLRYDSAALAFDRAAPSLQLAGTAALLAEKLRGGEAAAQIRLRDLAPVVNSLRLHYAQEPRVQELVAMFAQTRRLLND